MEKLEKEIILSEDQYRDCIRTSSGKYLDIFNPDPNMIDIEDIAHSLAMQCRFNGHLKRFYSVAEHSIHTSTLVSEEHKLAALLHDASEAYLCDIPRPFKNRLTGYYEIEDNLMKLIAKKFGFQYPFHEDIKKADDEMLQYEWDKLMMSDDHTFILSIDSAKDLFLEYYEKLINKRNKISD